jgi:Flp pilus assembly protein TadD
MDLDPAIAEVHARRAAELAPDNASVLGTLGWAQFKNRLFDEAAVSLKRARNLAPEDPMKHYMLGRVHAERGETEPAREEIREALRLDPAFARAESARRLLESLSE